MGHDTAEAKARVERELPENGVKDETGRLENLPHVRWDSRFELLCQWSVMV
jgi:hypothetical protein